MVLVNKMKTWIKGGLWGLGIGIILLLVEFFAFGQPFISLLIATPLLLLGLPIWPLWLVISFFIIGAIIGLIVGKIKARKEVAE